MHVSTTVRLALLALILTAFPLSGPFAGEAHAIRRPACYPGPRLETEYASSQLVFEGVVTSAGPTRAAPSREVTLHVIRSWKGAPAADVTVLFALPSCCRATMTMRSGYELVQSLRPGAHVLVFATVDGRYVTARASCSNTAIVRTLSSRTVGVLDRLAAQAHTPTGP